MSLSPSGSRRRRTALRLTVSALTLVGAGGIVALNAPTATAACADVEVVSARGTFEPGNLGIIVGDPVFNAIEQKLAGQSVASYSVDYPADLSRNSASEGNADLVDHVRNQAAACPGQKFILVGYSQGANVVDNSIGISSEGAVVGAPIVDTIPDDIEPRVAAVLVFGNPIRALGKEITGIYQERTLDLCAEGDWVCEPGGTDVGAHLSYRDNADEAADFAVGRV